jgi:DNA repair protein RecN (Recombination protein N)
MLVELTVRDFAIVEKATLAFGPGFTALTGETGAGKSIVVGALDLILGARPSDDLIRTGAERAEVTARFDLTDCPAAVRWLAEADIDDGQGELIVRRVVAKGGPNKAYLNGAPATVGQIRAVGETLVDLHGQHESQTLFDPANHLPFFDAFLGVERPLAACRDAYDEWRSAKKRLDVLKKNQGELERRLDMLRFQIDEIAQAELTVGEEERLHRDKQVLANAERLLEWANGAVAALDDDETSATAAAGTARGLVEKMAEVDPALRPVVEQVATALITLEEAAAEVRAYASAVEADPDRLAGVDDRLDLIRSLRKKYGEDVEAVLAYYEKAAEELATIEFDRDHLDKLEGEVAAKGAVAAAAALTLDAVRRKGIERFVKGVTKHLADLSMEKAAIQLAFTYPDEVDSPCLRDDVAVKMGPSGIGRMEILFSANPGQEPKPLSRIASGGEISRVMLAIKSALAGAQPAPVMIFDEIDTGIGGVTGDRLGEKMKALAARSQVFCVTHLAQVARSADTHLKVEKQAGRSATTVTVTSLDRSGRVAELARMATGEKATDAALKWADEALG